MVDKEPLPSFALLTHVEKIVDDKMQKHELEKRPVLNEISEKLSRLEALIKDGFPQGDPAAHRRVHEQYIKEAADRYDMIQGAKQRVLEGAVWAGLVLLCFAVWEYLKIEVKK